MSRKSELESKIRDLESQIRDIKSRISDQEYKNDGSSCVILKPKLMTITNAIIMNGSAIKTNGVTI